MSVFVPLSLRVYAYVGLIFYWSSTKTKKSSHRLLNHHLYTLKSVKSTSFWKRKHLPWPPLCFNFHTLIMLACFSLSPGFPHYHLPGTDVSPYRFSMTDLLKPSLYQDIRVPAKPSRLNSGLLNQFPPSVPLVFPIFHPIVKTIKCWTSRSYLTGVTAAQLRRHPSNMKVIQRIQQVFLENKIVLKTEL